MDENTEVKPDQAWKNSAAKADRDNARSRVYADKKVGARPSLNECLQGWVRSIEPDPSGAMPQRMSSNAPRKPTGKNLVPWDEYCWRLVQTAAHMINSPTQADLALEIAYFRMLHGTVAGWRNYNVIAFDPACTLRVNTAPEKANAASIDSVKAATDAGIKLFILANYSWTAFKNLLQETIDEADPYVKPTEEGEPGESENAKPIESITWGGLRKREA